MQRWDIYKAYINFEDDKSQGKRRPILIISVSNSEFIACKITSKYRDNELEYQIKDWIGAGLDTPSYVRILHKIYLPPNTQMIYLGKLQKVDIDNIKILCQKYGIKLNENYKETNSQGQILKRGDLSEYKISDKELEEVRNRDIMENKENLLNIKEDTNISIDNMEVNIDKVKNKSVRVDEDHQLEEIPPHNRDQLLIELKDVTNDFTIPSDTIIVGYESEKDYVMDILSENGYGCEDSMKGEWFEISFNKKEEESLVENIKEEKYNIGSNKLNITEEEKQRLEDLASKLMVNSPNDYKYQVEETYEDYGSGMKWFTIICYNRSGDSWQVLNTKEWLDLMNTGNIDAVYQSVVNDKYFQDKQKEINEMNMWEKFNYIKD